MPATAVNLRKDEYYLNQAFIVYSLYGSPVKDFINSHGLYSSAQGNNGIAYCTGGYVDAVCCLVAHVGLEAKERKSRSVSHC